MNNILFLLIIIYIPNSYSTQTLLLKDMINSEGLPRNFRLREDSLEGIQKFSGSAQFSVKELDQIKEFVKNHDPNANLSILDLRQELHGFVNGDPVTLYQDRDWVNFGHTNQNIEIEQKDYFNYLRKLPYLPLHIEKEKNKKTGEITKYETVNLKNEAVFSEEELLKSKNIQYTRFYVTDHLAPSQSEVDKFIDFVKHSPDNQWIHFHCRGGSGRTTTFMVMYELLIGQNNLPLNQVLELHTKLNGKDLRELPDKKDFRYYYAKHRRKFIIEFFKYTHSQDYKDGISWTEWNNK